MDPALAILGSRYEVIQKLGEGRVGIVFLVRDSQKNRECTLKLLKEQYRSDEEALQRFQFEFITVNRISHPNIVQVYDLHRYYYTREYMAGKNFNSLIKSDMADVLEAATGIASGLEEIHRLGIIHRDLRPGTLRFSENGKVKILDFGFSLTMDPSYKPLDIRTAPDVTYMAPEQVKGYEIDPRADLYSLGVILFELTTGKLPFETDKQLSASSIMTVKQLESKAPSPRIINPKIPAEMDRLILSCLEKDLSQRVESATDVLERLHEISGRSEVLVSKVERGAEILYPPQFVHRDAQLSKLLTLFDKCLQTGSEFVVVTGETGVGKSRLLKELQILRMIYEERFFTIICSSRDFTSFSPFIQMMETLVKRHPKDNKERQKLVERYGDFLLSFCPGLSKESDFFRCHKTDKMSVAEKQRNLITILQDLMEEQFIAIFIENLQWCDVHSVELLETLLTSKTRKDMFLSGTYLGDSVLEETPFQKFFYRLKMSRQVHEISLTNLAQSRLNLFIGSMLGQWQTDSNLVSRIFHLTQGNPGLVEKIMLDLAERGLIFKKGGKFIIDIRDYSRIEKPPEIVDELINRAKGLNKIFLQFFKAASALERKLNIDILRRVVKLKESQISLITSDLVAQGFLVLLEEEEKRKYLAFGSLKLKEVTYQQIPEKERKKLHESIGSAMEKLRFSDKGTIASHFERSENYKKAIRYYQEAAQESETQQKYLAAILYYEKMSHTLKFKENKKQELFVFERLGNLYHKISNFSRAIENYKAGLKLAEKLGHTSAFYHGLGSVYLSQGDWKQAYNYFNVQYAASLKNKKTRGAYEMAQMGYTYLYRDKYQKAESLFQDAQKIAQEIKDNYTLALSLGGLGEIQLIHGEWEQALTTLESAYTITESLNEYHLSAKILSKIATTHFHLSQFHQAFKFMEDALYLSELQNNKNLLISLQNYFGELFESKGREEKAFHLYKDALKLAEEHNDNIGIALSCLNLGRCHMALGNFKEAKNVILRSTTLYEHLGNQYGVAINYANLGKTFLHEGNDTKAKSCFVLAEKRFSAIKVECGLQKICCDYSEVLMRLHNMPKAMKRLQRGMKYAFQYNDRETHGKILLKLSRYYILEKQYKLAEKYFNEGLGILEFLPNKTLFANGSLQYAEYLLQLEKKDPQGRMESILQVVRNAAAIYQKTELTEEFKKAQRLLEECESLYSSESEFVYSHFSEINEHLRELEAFQTRLKKEVELQVSQLVGEDMDQAQIDEILAKVEQKIKDSTTETQRSIEELKIRSQTLQNELEQLSKERQRIILMQRFSHIINSVEEVEKLLRMILDVILEMTEAERGFLLFKDETDPSGFDFKVTRNSAQQDIEKPENYISMEVVKRTFTTEEPILSDEAELDKSLEDLNSVFELKIKSLMALPFRMKSRILGVLYLDHSTKTKLFQKEDLRSVIALTDQAAVGIENALLYGEVADKERIEQELNLASTVQKGLCAKEIPQVSGVELYGVMQPARKVGGDYYDFIPYGEDSLDLCVGDVTGKGIGAGLVMVMAKTVLKLLCDGHNDTKKILLRLNEMIYENTDKFIFMSFILFRWKANLNQFTYTGAGHEYILVYRFKEQKIERILCGGTVLGVKEDIEDRLIEKQLELFPNDRVVLYSDGITEAMNPKKEEFGMEALVETIQENATKPPKEMVQSILDRIAIYRDTAEQSDDITIVVLQKT